MVYINSHTISGNIGADATSGDANGTFVANFRFANTSPYRDKVTTWYSASFFGPTAKRLFDEGILTKGQAIIVTGESSTRTYEKDGVERQSNDFRVEKLQYLRAATDAPTASSDDDF